MKNINSVVISTLIFTLIGCNRNNKVNNESIDSIQDSQDIEGNKLDDAQNIEGDNAAKTLLSITSNVKLDPNVYIEDCNYSENDMNDQKELYRYYSFKNLNIGEIKDDIEPEFFRKVSSSYSPSSVLYIPINNGTDTSISRKIIISGKPTIIKVSESDKVKFREIEVVQVYLIQKDKKDCLISTPAFLPIEELK